MRIYKTIPATVELHQPLAHDNWNFVGGNKQYKMKLHGPQTTACMPPMNTVQLQIDINYARVVGTYLGETFHNAIALKISCIHQPTVLFVFPVKPVVTMVKLVGIAKQHVFIIMWEYDWFSVPYCWIDDTRHVDALEFSRQYKYLCHAYVCSA